MSMALPKLISPRKILVGLAVVGALALVFGLVGNLNTRAGAASGKDFKAGNIIDDSVFYNSGAMTASQIQSFLNSKVPVCDTKGQQLSEFGGPDLNGDGKVQRWEWGKKYYNQTTFTCLRDYKQNTPSMEAASGLCASVGGGTKTAAQIIYDVGKACGINPQVLLVLLQKEQSLVTDTWPLKTQYDHATGFDCPDTAPCNPSYAGFFYQVYNAAKQFRIYKKYPYDYNYIAGRTNNIYWHPDLSRCGSSSVFIENQATAALYIYTPYRPNQKALENLYGTGDSCSSYGNRNFWRLFTDWFGNPSSRAVYSWSLVSQGVYKDSGYTKPLPANIILTPGQKVYVRVQAKNTGNRVWYQPGIRLATSHPHNRSSVFRDSSWISNNRPAQIREQSVQPGGTATFITSFTAPSNRGYYKEYFTLVVDGVTWMNDLGLYFTISVQPARDVTVSYDSAAQDRLDGSNLTLYPGSKRYVQVNILNNTDSPLPANTRLATSDPKDRISQISDESWISANRVDEFDAQVLPDTVGTYKFSINAPQTLGSFEESFGLVIDGQKWVENDSIKIGGKILERPPSELPAGMLLNAGESLLARGDRYRLVMQGDGNLVIYSPSRAVWASNTVGKGGNRLVMQGDGNLVIYSPSRAVWASNTVGK